MTENEVENIAILESAGYEEDGLLCPECGCETLTRDQYAQIVDAVEGDDGCVMLHKRICPYCQWHEVTYD